jgi:hypothetical protein
MRKVSGGRGKAAKLAYLVRLEMGIDEILEMGVPS